LCNILDIALVIDPESSTISVFLHDWYRYERKVTRQRRTHRPEFKAKLALAAAQVGMTVVELMKQSDVHVNQATESKKQ
jgi:transposase-like protein